MAQPGGPAGPQSLHLLQRLAENLLIKEKNGIEGLVLRTGGHLPAEGQFGKKPFPLLLTGQVPRHLLDRRHVTPQPVQITLLRGEGFVLATEDFPRLLHRFLRRHEP